MIRIVWKKITCNCFAIAVDQLDTPPNGAWYLKPMAQILSGLGLPQSAVEQFEYAGYYTLLIRPGFRIISLNTQYTNPLNFWVTQIVILCSFF